MNEPQHEDLMQASEPFFVALSVARLRYDHGLRVSFSGENTHKQTQRIFHIIVLWFSRSSTSAFFACFLVAVIIDSCLEFPAANVCLVIFFCVCRTEPLSNSLFAISLLLSSPALPDFRLRPPNVCGSSLPLSECALAASRFGISFLHWVSGLCFL